MRHSTDRASLAAQLRFFWNLRRKRFVHALAALPTGSWPRSDEELWAAYKLGMYAAVAEAEWDGRHIRSGIAIAVSSAACGYKERCREIATLLLSRKKAAPHLAALMADLAPYMPDYALALSEQGGGKFNLTPALHLSLLLQCGRNEEASHIFDKYVSELGGISSLSEKELEILLLASSILQSNPDEQEYFLNSYFSRKNLSSIELIDRKKPLGVNNLRAATDIPSINGPLISVLMTAFNAEHHIEAAISGLLKQSYRNIEIIVVDDASTDGSVEVVSKMAQHDHRIKLIRQSINKGTYLAKSAGFEVARGEFVTCHDADDWSHPQRIERQVKPLLDNRNLVATTSLWVRIRDDGLFYARLMHPLARLNPASPMFRRQLVLDHMGLWEGVRTGADSEFHARLRLVFGNDAVQRVSQVLTLGSHRADSLMNSAETGYAEEKGLRERLSYWDNWRRRHVQYVREGGPWIAWSASHGS